MLIGLGLVWIVGQLMDVILDVLFSCRNEDLDFGDSWGAS